MKGLEVQSKKFSLDTTTRNPDTNTSETVLATYEEDYDFSYNIFKLVKNCLIARVNGIADEAAREAAVYTWKAGNDTVDKINGAGSYMLEVSLPAKEGVYNAAAPLYVPVIIKKKPLEIISIPWIEPGTTVTDALKNILALYAVIFDDDEDNNLRELL